jgi:hypothetical protein
MMAIAAGVGFQLVSEYYSAAACVTTTAAFY